MYSAATRQPPSARHARRVGHMQRGKRCKGTHYGRHRCYLICGCCYQLDKKPRRRNAMPCPGHAVMQRKLLT